MRSRSPPTRDHRRGRSDHRDHRGDRDRSDRGSSRRDRARNERTRSRTPPHVRDRRPAVDGFGREKNPNPRDIRSPVRDRRDRRDGPSGRHDDRGRSDRSGRDRHKDGATQRRRQRSRSRSPVSTSNGRRDRGRSSSSSDSSSDAKKGTVASGAVPKSLMERPEITDADLAGKTDEEQAMMKLMGFGGFETTKGKKVTGNDMSAVNLLQKRKYRQYMNRKGGFNRPLDFVA